MKRLIVNGDDFGFTSGVNAGIVRAFREGILTSTTLMANGAAFEDAVERARSCPGLAVGCHLVLVGGRVTARREDVPSLASRDGYLPNTLLGFVGRLAGGTIRREDVERELRAQIDRLRRAGIEPTHLDTHKHTHSHPKVMEALGRVASECGITRVRLPFEGLRSADGTAERNGRGSLKQRALALAARTAAPRFPRIVKSYGLRTPDHFFGLLLTGGVRAAALLPLLERLPDGTSELMCHPGVCDEDLEAANTRLKRQRETELQALVDPAVRRAIEERGIKLVSYRELN